MSINDNIKQYGPYALLGIVFIMLFHSPIAELFHDWDTDPNYGHGLLIPIVTCYLLWMMRDELAVIQADPSPWPGFITLVAASLFFVLGTAAAEWFVSRTSMIIFLIGIILVLGGMPVLKKVWFPVCYLFLMIPVPYLIYYKLTFPLQLFSTISAHKVIGIIGIAGIREGNILHFTNYTMEVIEACSGLRSAMVLISLSAVIAYLTPVKKVGKISLFLSAIPVAVAANIVRLIITALLGVFAGAEAASGFLHDLSGMLMFFCGLLGLLIIRTIILWLSSRKVILAS